VEDRGGLLRVMDGNGWLLEKVLEMPGRGVHVLPVGATATPQCQCIVAKTRELTRSEL
jgi:hypothetical protein